jgi:hypothetical protein
MSAPDALIPNVPDLFWKQMGRSGWLYNGPVVFSAPDRYSRGELRQKVGCVIGCVPDNLSTLWVLCWSDSFTEDEKVTVKENLLHLPLRFRGQVYEECVNRAKGYLVDRLFPSLPPERRVNIAWFWSEDDLGWVLTVSEHHDRVTGHQWCFGEKSYRHGTTVEGLNGYQDYLVALAAAIKATEEARWK